MSNPLLVRRRMLLATLLLALLIWLPRGLALDRFVTADEHAWLTRSGNFYRALANGDYAGTFQRHHPGVTITWAGTLGFLQAFPGYAQEAPQEYGWLTEEIEPFLREAGHDPVELLAAGRGFMVLGITLALLTSFGLVVRLLGFWPGLIGMGLIGLSPFHSGLSRLMHLDGLLSSLMLLALLAFMVHLSRGSSIPLNFQEKNVSGKKVAASWSWWLLLSGCAAGLAWLTRSPGLFLGPFVAGVVIVKWLNERSRATDSPSLFSHIITLAVWTLVGLALFVALWPAMWVDPIGSLIQVLSAAEEYAAEGHLKPIFFNGTIYSGDPGWIFYPIAYLWRATPITLVGLALAGIGVGATLLRSRTERLSPEIRSLLTLFVYALLFGLFMNLGAKKFDRYLLPSFLPLELIAGWGWAYLVRGVTGLSVGSAPVGVRKRATVATVLVALIFGSQAWFSLPTFPYYLSYYNPLMGGSSQAPQVMQIGWGEGADLAADYLATIDDATEDAAQVKVASAYTNGPFSYFFPGRTLPIYFWDEADYAVLYAQDFQRRLPGPRQIRAFEQMTPIHTVQVNGLDYARIYDVKASPLPEYVTDWREEGKQEDTESAQIRLISYLFPSSSLAPGETLPMTLYFRGLAPINENLSVLVRLMAPDGTEVARNEGWPWGSPTSTWQPGDVWPDGHALLIPPETAPGPYRVEVSFTNPRTQQRLTVTRPATGETLGETLLLDFVDIRGQAEAPREPLSVQTSVGNFVQLQATQWIDEAGNPLSIADATLSQTAAITLELFWQVEAYRAINYTTFVHIVGPDGTLLTQVDQQPWGGFYPTAFWDKGRTIRQPLTLQIPPDAAPGSYAVHVGLYDSETVERLPIFQAGEVVGDSVVIGQLRVQ